MFFFDPEPLKVLVLSIIKMLNLISIKALEYATGTNPKFLEIADLIATRAVVPLASILFAMFATMQVYRAISTLNDVGAPQGGSARFETIGFLLLKLGIMYAFIRMMPKFLWGLYSVDTRYMI